MNKVIMLVFVVVDKVLVRVLTAVATVAVFKILLTVLTA
jgi:hypothetical protein